MRKISTFMLIAISVSAIVSLRGLALMASGGLTTLGLALLAAFCFLIPSTYVCAKLATHILQRGGVYEWVRIAFGQRWGFIAIWLEWINNIVEFPATLAAIIGMFYLLFTPNMPSAGIFTASMLILLWAALWYNHFPLQLSSWLNVIGSVGTIIIAAFIIILGIIWFVAEPHQIQNLHSSTPLSINAIAIFVSFIGAYSGIQITGFHTQDVADPKRQYAIALPVSCLIVMVIILGASTVMALLIPADQLSVITGVEQMVQIFFRHFNLPNIGLFISAFVLISITASFSAWLLGPARGMQAALAEAGITHKIGQLNRYQMPIGILWLQGFITSGLILLFLVLPSIKTAFWLMVAITSQFTALMYVLVFAAGLKLIAKSLIGKILCCLGLITCFLGFCVGVFAPTQLKLVSSHQYTWLVLIGDAIIILIGYFFAKHITLHSQKNNQV